MQNTPLPPRRRRPSRITSRRGNLSFVHPLWPNLYIKEIDFMHFWEDVTRFIHRGPVLFVRDLFYIWGGYPALWRLCGAITYCLGVIGSICLIYYSLCGKFFFTVIGIFTNFFSHLFFEILYISAFSNLQLVDLLGVVFLLSAGFFVLRQNALQLCLSIFFSVFFSAYVPVSRTLDLFFDSFGVISGFVIIFSFFLFVLTLEQLTAAKRSSTLAFFVRNKVLDQIVLSTLLFIFIVFFLSASNLFIMFITYIGINIAIYALIGQFSFSLRAQEAAIKYFVLGLLAAGFFLFGVFLIYLSFGTLSLDGILALSSSSLLLPLGVPGFGAASIVLVLLFKLSAFPLQKWAPDVYEGSSWFTVSVLTLVIKPVFILALLSCLYYFSFAMGPLSVMLLLSGIGSIALGTFGAMQQHKLKRFLAFSSISHIGFLLSLISFSPLNPIWAIWYLVSYVASNFIILVFLSGIQVCGLQATQARAITYIAELAYINRETPFRSNATLPLTVALCSLAGLPPFLGFFTKLNLILSCLAADSVLGWLLFVLILLFLPVSVFNYFRFLRTLWFGGVGFSSLPLAYVNIFVSPVSFYCIALTALGLSVSFIFWY